MASAENKPKCDMFIVSERRDNVGTHLSAACGTCPTLEILLSLNAPLNTEKGISAKKKFIKERYCHERRGLPPTTPT